ncbi:MAG: hypothetical protein R3A52_11520 [Polyangiales bacterium]
MTTADGSVLVLGANAGWSSMRRALLAAALCASCGTLASPGEGDRDLPVGRGGPFRLLGPTGSTVGPAWPSDPARRFDDPSAVRLDDGAVRLFTDDDGASPVDLHGAPREPRRGRWRR